MARHAQRAGNLPNEATSFIGRRRELSEIRSKVATARLVSLVGPGGVGKTRLAIRAATDLQRGFSDGAWLVELADVRDPSLAGNAVLAALDLRDQAATDPLALLLAYVRSENLLLVIDNCEHLLEAAAHLVSELIDAAPGVRVITTSREPLSLSAEHVIPVPPLELPSAARISSHNELRQNEAVMLFVDRAAAASGGFTVNAANKAAVVDVCRRLDGLPLAIELAAVRTRVLTVEQIRDRLTDRFTLLTRGSRAALPRHQTLKTTLDWSYDLLDTGERALLRRLCLFSGRFLMEDVESVCSTEDLPRAGVLEQLSSLVDKSLVMKEDVGPVACYRLHETMREYAALQLKRATEEDSFEERFIEYYRTKCPRFRMEAGLVEWLEWIDLEIDNIRWALRRCLDHPEDERGMELVLLLGGYWTTRATSEGVRWLDEVLVSTTATSPGSARQDLQARTYHLRGFLALLQADPTAARAAFEPTHAVARATGLPVLLSHSLSLASIGEHMAGDRVAARRLLDEAELVTDALDDVGARITLLQARALDGLFVNDLDAARSAALEGARLSRESGDVYSLEMMLMNVGSAALMRGELDESKPMLCESLRMAHQLDDRVAQYYLLDALGCEAARAGQAVLAAQLMGAAETVRSSAAARLIPTIAPLISQAEAVAVAALGRSKYDAEFAAGQRLTRAAAVALALAETPEAAPAPVVLVGSELLSRREREIAQLVGEGLTNRQIGARLFISEHTVDSHIRKIMNKLGVNTRARIAARVATGDVGC